MRTLTLVLLTFVFFLTSAGIIDAGDNENVTVNIPTIQCGTCKKNITKALNNLDGVTSVKVDMKKKTAFVTFDDSKTNTGAIEDAITSAGYDANDKKADHDAYEKLDDCCKVGGMH
jgi:periplasmic mercuric ion binding protein